MTSCAAPKPMTVTKIEYAIPSPILLTPCAPMEMSFSTNGELLNAMIDLIGQYRICAAQMDAVIEYFENIQIVNEGEP